jgi:hypothetical protein
MDIKLVIHFNTADGLMVRHIGPMRLHYEISDPYPVLEMHTFRHVSYYFWGNEGGWFHIKYVLQLVKNIKNLKVIYGLV